MSLPEHCHLTDEMSQTAVVLTPVSKDDLAIWLERAKEADAQWVTAVGFEAKSGTFAPLNNGGTFKEVLVGTGASAADAHNMSWLAAVAKALPQGSYRLPAQLDPAAVKVAALGWCLEAYSFDRYKSDAQAFESTLCLTDADMVAEVRQLASASCLTRDLVNTPAEDMGPAELQDAAEALAERFDGEIETICGDALLDENFPAIHAVGRAATEAKAPRLIDLRWQGAEGGPKLTLVGKGVCFDTGGLNLKPAGGMRWMKKDMGGAAHALGLAQLIMEAGLPLSLRVLVPAVENAVSGSSYRPGDVIPTRKGTTVEIGNTDAEGRVVLCDALDLASEEKPDLLIDFATLTGAARVALGPDLPATYTNDDTVWQHLEVAAKDASDPLWRMPLWAPYDKGLSSTVADMGNITDDGFAGSITAALYLQRFVGEDIPWVHYDVFAWSPKSKPGQPMGGNAQGLRATFGAIKNYFSL